MSNSQVTTWLSTIYKVEHYDEWHHLIEFLESNFKVQQQKLYIENTSENKSKQQAKGHVVRYNNHFNDNLRVEPRCCFCEVEGHIAINGLKGAKIV